MSLLLLLTNAVPVTTAVALSDDFNDNSTDLTKWGGAYTSGTTAYLETGGQLQINVSGVSGEYSAYNSTNAYDFTGKHAQIQVIAQFSNTLAETQNFMQLFVDGNNRVSIGKTGSVLSFEVRVAGTPTFTQITYDVTNHAYWRYAESGGVLYWLTSANGTNWTIVKSQANPFAVTALFIGIGAGAYAANTSSQTIFDNFNPGSVTQTLTGTAGYSDADAFGVGSIASPITLTGTGATNTQSFGAGALTHNITLTGTGYANAQSFGAGVLTTLITLSGTGYSDADSFGAGSIVRNITLTGTGFANTSDFGAGTLAAIVTLVGTGYSDADAFGAGAITTTITLTGTGEANSQAFGVGSLSNVLPGTTLSGTGMVNTSSFGSGSVSTAVTLVGTGYEDTDNFGAGTIATTITSAGTGYANSNSFGTGSLATLYAIVGSAFIDADSFGSGSVTPGGITSVGTGYADPDAFGVGSLTLGNQIITGTGWANGGAIARKYYLDADGNVYWVTNQTIGLVERV